MSFETGPSSEAGELSPEQEKLKQRLFEQLKEMIAEEQSKYPDRGRLQGERAKSAARAFGYIDGYMRVMLEAQLATKAELKALIEEAKSSASS